MKVGVFVHARWVAARRLAEELRTYLADHVDQTWVTSEWQSPAVRENMPGTDILICLGGDGTVLYAARSVIPHSIPILGVNMGRLGFLAELRPSEVMERMPAVLAGDYRLEQRMMLQASIPSLGATHHGLNDVVVGRRQVGRPIYVDVTINNERLAIHRCDAMIVATATGSTAYSLSAGGPILDPLSRDLVLTPVAPHMTGARSLVLPSDTAIELSVGTDEDAVVSVDGQVDHAVTAGETITVCSSPHVARFVRFSRPEDYYSMLSERLDWLRVLTASGHPELFEENGIATAK